MKNKKWFSEFIRELADKNWAWFIATLLIAVELVQATSYYPSSKVVGAFAAIFLFGFFWIISALDDVIAELKISNNRRRYLGRIIPKHRR